MTTRKSKLVIVASVVIAAAIIFIPAVAFAESESSCETEEGLTCESTCEEISSDEDSASQSSDEDCSSEDENTDNVEGDIPQDDTSAEQEPDDDSVEAADKEPDCDVPADTNCESSSNDTAGSEEETGQTYQTELTPDGVVGTDQDTQFEITITEVGGSNIAEVKIEGNAFAIVSLDDLISSCGTWDPADATLAGNILTIAGNALSNMEWVTAFFTAKTPDTPGIYNFDVDVKDEDGVSNSPETPGQDDSPRVAVNNSIQGAINDAEPGDTIFVHPHIYEESLVIDKSIKLIGADQDSTKIQPAAGNHAIEITGNDVELIVKNLQLNVTGVSRLANFSGRENTTIIFENSKMDYSQAGRGIQAHNSPNSNIILLGSTLEASDAAGMLGSGYAILLIGSLDSTLTITDSTVTAAHYAIYLASAGARVYINNGSAVTGYAVIAATGPGGYIIDVEDSILTGRTFWSGYFFNPPVEDANSFATIAFQTSNCTMHVKNSIITNEWVGDSTSYQMLMHLGRPGYNFVNNKVYLDNLTQLINNNALYAPLIVGGDAEKGNAWYINGVEQELPPIIYNYYVHPDGDDENDGLRPVTAFRTLAKAEEVAGPGETIFVYHEPPLPPDDELPEDTLIEEVPEDIARTNLIFGLNPLVTVKFINECSFDMLAELREVYVLHLQAFEAAHDQLGDRAYALKYIELSITRAVIQTIQARLFAEFGLSYDKALVIKAYEETMVILEKYGHFLSETQMERAVKILDAISDLIGTLNS